jgi:hypothetical protein
METKNADVMMAGKSRKLDFIPTTKTNGAEMKSLFALLWRTTICLRD